MFFSAHNVGIKNSTFLNQFKFSNNYKNRGFLPLPDHFEAQPELMTPWPAVHATRAIAGALERIYKLQLEIKMAH